MSSVSMRGLTTFITDIRQCKSKDQEQARVEKEMAKIRQKFLKQGGLNGYQRKKYVWKLLYIYILGYEVEFGHQEAADLINSGKFSEKYTGYIALSILIKESDVEIHKTIANSIRYDINSNNEINQSLAISTIGSLAPQELVHQLDKDIIKIAFQQEGHRCTPFVRKKAVLCLLRMFRKFPQRYDPKKWTNNVLSLFESSRQQTPLGYLSASCSFLLGISQFIDPEPFKDLRARIVKYLQKLVVSRECSQDYMYYHIPNPWLQVKLLKILQLFPMPQDTTVQKVLTDILKRIVKRTEVNKSVNKNNANHGILFEAANLIIHYRKTKDISDSLNDDIVKLLGIFISVREPNLKYLGLETMCKFSQHNESLIDTHLTTILKSLKMNDISIKKRALDLLYLMCTQSSAKRIVEELLSYSEDWADSSIKEELVLKIAILAERYAEDLMWYVDVVVRLVGSSGDFVTEDVWHRIIQMITGFGREKENNKVLQKYAAQKLFNSINLPHIHPTLLMIGSFVISEFAEFLVESGKEEQKLFDVLYRHFHQTTEKVKCMMLNGFAKLASKYPDLQDQCQMVFEVCSEHFDPDLQQRGIEYNAILGQSLEFQQKVLARQPTYSEEIQNSNPLLKKIYKLKLGNAKDNKDPTVAAEAQKRAKESVESFVGKDTAAEKAAYSQEKLSIKPSEYFNSLKDQILYAFCEKQLTLDGKGCITPLKDKLPSNFLNHTNVKNLLPITNGVLTEDSNLTINYKSEYKEHMGQIALQFLCNQGKMENINLMITCNDNQGMDFNISPVNYSQENPSMIVQVMSVDSYHVFPTAQLFYDIQNGPKSQKLEIRLPIFTNKFIQPVNMPQETFDHYFDNYSQKSNDQYKKLEVLIKNPAPTHIPLNEVMKKAGSLLQNCFNLKVMSKPDMENIKTINGVGRFYYKDTQKQEVQQLNIMVQIECYEDFKEELRVSYRGNCPWVLQNLHQLIQLYF